MPPIKYESAAEAAARWGVTKQLVSQWCRDNRIPGVKLVGGRWLIPAAAERPEPAEPWDFTTPKKLSRKSKKS